MQPDPTGMCETEIEEYRFDGSSLSKSAKARMLSRRGEPLLFADWERVLMIHFEVDAGMLQPDVPFELELRDGCAFVSLVAFTMHSMRLRIGGKLAAWLFKPIATHEFLNVRTYVRHNGETGIHFLAEWLSNRLAVRLGPRTFSLPYRYGRIAYQQDWRSGELSGFVEDAATGAALSYRADLEAGALFAPCKNGSLDEWLMERYTAFNAVYGRRRFFRVWHPPWPQVAADVTILEETLLTSAWPCLKQARLVAAGFSPGVRNVWMGRPHRIKMVK